MDDDKILMRGGDENDIREYAAGPGGANLSEDDFGEISEADFDLISTDIEVAPNIFQSKEDYKANMAFDEARDNEL